MALHAQLPSPARRRASALVLVMVTLVFAATALVLFIERASTEIIVQGRQVRADDLRVRGYSAMQAVLGVLNEFQQIDGQLQDPAQGWADALALAGWDEERDGRVEVEFIDESGRFPINLATRDPLIKFFEQLGIETRECESLADNLLEWRGATGQEATANPFGASEFDYERQPIPYTQPGKKLGTFSELLLVRGFAKHFADEAGLPNARFRQLAEIATLHDVGTINLNSAGDEVLRSWVGLTDLQISRLRDTQARPGMLGDVPYLRDAKDVERILGGSTFQQPAGTAIEVLRIRVNVKDGSGTYPLAAVIRTTGGGGNREGGGSGGGNAGGSGGNRPGGGSGANSPGGSSGASSGSGFRPGAVSGPPAPPNVQIGTGQGQGGGGGRDNTPSLVDQPRSGRQGGSSGKNVAGTPFRMLELSEGTP